jgi:ferrochelatase
MNHKAVLLINVGTPDSPTVNAVRKYLFAFLNDRRVIDLPWVPQKLLVNGIIVPFRAPKSTKIYKQLWDQKGSPLLYHGLSVKNKLQERLENADVFFAMRYGNPSLKQALKDIQYNRYEKLVVVPLFPQYASSTTGTAIEAVFREVKKWNNIPEIATIQSFYDNEEFIKAFVERIHSFHIERYDHVLFSYHGLPVRQLNKTHPEVKADSCTCENSMPQHGHFCYKAQCYETTRRLASALQLPKHEYSVSFQSRLSNKWMKPFTDETVQKLAREGHRNLAVIAPSFVADCLETTVELGIENAALFKKAGGSNLQLIPGLNDTPQWINTLEKLILQKL